MTPLSQSYPSHAIAETASVAAHRSLPSVCWGAILAGTVAGLALQVLFMMLGSGLGFALYQPLTDDNPVASLGAGAMVIQGISAVLSLWFGGWVAGRLTPAGVRRSGWLHGFTVWCTAMVAGVIFVSLGAGWALGDLSKLVGGGLSAAGKPAAAAVGGATDLAKDAVQQSDATLASFTDEALGRRATDAPTAENVRAKREIGRAVARLFNPAQPDATRENRSAAVQALVNHAGLSEAEADRTITEWTTAFDQLKADLEALKAQVALKARQAADQAADVLAVFSLCAFVAFLFGAISAAHGGAHGAMCATRRDRGAALADGEARAPGAAI